MTNTNMIFIIFMMSDENESLRWKNKKFRKIQLCDHHFNEPIKI